MKASWYKSGSRTASGEKFNPRGLTAAHKTLPFGTILCLSYKGNSVKVRVNDRGPFTRGRELDVSEKAAEVLKFKHRGHANLNVQVCGKAKKKT